MLQILNSSKYFRLSLFILLGAFYSSPLSSAQTQQDRPKIVVGLVVDQMRWDYLYRFQDRYVEGGFKRLLREGFSCENTQINYSLTATGPGHACVYTGSVPAVHGIAGNTWYDRSIRKEVNCVEDTLVQTVGTLKPGKPRSPRPLLVTTIGDELKLSNNMRSKVIGISLKDRGAILPGGHLSNGSFWYDGNSGNFITSTYYMQDLPPWLQAFNDRNLSGQYAQQVWETLYPTGTYLQSTEDDKPYEKTAFGKDKPVFPYHLGYKENNYGALSGTPYGNTILIDLAKAAVEGEKLGSGDFTDMLTVSFSATDGLGHQLGPNAVEIEDMYLRLDRDLADFFTYLDQRFGEKGYLLFITADHGASHSAGFLLEHRLPSGIYNLGFIAGLDAHIQKKFGIKNVIESAQNAEIYLNWKVLEEVENKEKIGEIKSEMMDFLNQQDGIARACFNEDLVSAPWPEKVRNRYINSYNASRGGDIVLMPHPGWQASLKGTNHGLWYPYDSHIPLVWMGWNVSPGQTSREIGMTDIAPTLAALLKIQMPSGSIGHPILEITDRK